MREATRSNRAAVAAILFAVMFGGSPARGQVPDPPDPPVARVRSRDPFLAGLLVEAPRRPATFKRLLTSIASTNGIVQVEPGTCSHKVRACLQIWMYFNGSDRFVRVLVNPQRAESIDDLLGSIGHELQHAIEALSEPAVKDGDRLYNFFRRYAPTTNSAFETLDAVDAGNQVRDELQRQRFSQSEPR